MPDLELTGRLLRASGVGASSLEPERVGLSDAADLLQEAIWHAPGGREGIPLDEGAITTEGGKRLLTQLLGEAAPETRGGSPAPRGR